VDDRAAEQTRSNHDRKIKYDRLIKDFNILAHRSSRTASDHRPACSSAIAAVISRSNNDSIAPRALAVRAREPFLFHY
jgi:hypothetical protein